MSEHEVFFTLNPLLPRKRQVIQIISYQDKVKGMDNLTLPEQLNNIVDELANMYVIIPKDRNVLSILISIYFEGKYITNDYHRII